jgi:hypothetical protein
MVLDDYAHMRAAVAGFKARAEEKGVYSLSICIYMDINMYL